MQKLSVEYYDILAKHSFDVGNNTELKVKLTSAHGSSVHVQSPPTPIHLRYEVLVELAFLQFYGTVTFLLNSIVVQSVRKPLDIADIDRLRHVNQLLRSDYSGNNFPISIMTDAVHHFAGLCLTNSIGHNPIIVCKWLTPYQSNSCHSILP